MTLQTPPTDDQLQNAARKTIREILQMGFSTNDAQQGKKDEHNALFFHSNGDTTKNQGRDEWLFTTESLKQAETTAKAIAANVQGATHADPRLVGQSYSDGKDRIDIKGIEKENETETYKVKRLEDHPFLKDKKSLRDEKWNAEDLHAAIAADLLSQVQTYTYTSKQFPYELQEMTLRSKGLVDIQRTDNGSLLTFDRPVTRAGLNIDSLSPTPETTALLQQPALLSEPQHPAQQADSPLPKSDTPNTPENQNPAKNEILKQYADLKKKHPDALMLFRIGDFYKTYQEDAAKAAQILGIILHKNDKTQEASFPHHTLDTYLPKLIRAGLRVAICDQLVTNRPSRSTQKTQTPNQAEDNTRQSSPQNDQKADIINQLDQMIGKHLGIAISPEQPIPTQTAKGIGFVVDRIVRENEKELRLYGFDSQQKERSVGIEKVSAETLAQILSHLKQSQGKTISETTTTPHHETEKQTAQEKETSSLGREARKIVSLSKVYENAKKDHPENLVFIRQREPETKRFMYQTFGVDAELLTKEISPSVEIMRPEIKGQQYPTASLLQGALGAVKADMMTHDIYPVIINAKGERIDNDHFLAFSKEDRQAFITQRQTQAQQRPPSQQSKGESLSSPTAAGQKAEPSTQAGSQQADALLPQQKPKQNAQLTLDFTDDALIQYDVHQNSHVTGMYDIRLYVNGEKAGAHRLSKEDRDGWHNKEIPIQDLMRKYFPKELENVNIDNLTWVGTGQAKEQAPSRPLSPSPKTNADKERTYGARAEKHQLLSEQLKQSDNHAVVLLQLNSKDGKEFYQTFNQDATFVAGSLGRKTMRLGDITYLSLTSEEVSKLKERLGNQDQAIKIFHYTGKDSSLTNSQTTSPDGSPLMMDPSLPNPLPRQNIEKPSFPTAPTITPTSHIEYTIQPVIRTNKETKQQERIPGMYALSIATEGQTIGRKMLTRDERDLLNARPGEITNVINAKFAKELGGVTLDFKQVHRPAVPEEQWKNLSIPNGMTLENMPHVTRNTETGKYEMTAQIDGMTLGPKPMFRQDVNDFFDHARPAAEIVARVFRDELKNPNLLSSAQSPTTPKISPDDVISLWHSARYSQGNDDNPEKVAFVQREGKFGMFYQTFNDDAKNMSKVTNRSLKVVDTESHKNVVYANIPQDQIQEITQQLRKAGFQPFAVNTDGQPVSLVTGQKVVPARLMALDDGRKVENVNLRNDNGRWLMAASIDGKPLPEREVTHDDAVIFKQGQQAMADIVLKYYANDFNSTQTQSHTNHQNIGR